MQGARGAAGTPGGHCGGAWAEPPPISQLPPPRPEGHHPQRPLRELPCLQTQREPPAASRARLGEPGPDPRRPSGRPAALKGAPAGPGGLRRRRRVLNSRALGASWCPWQPPAYTYVLEHVLKVDIAFYEKLCFENKRHPVNDFFESSSNKSMVLFILSYNVRPQALGGS